MVKTKGSGKGKTETIKERAIYLYLPSQQMVREWKDLAKKSGLSISKFVREHVENSLQQEKEKSYVSRVDLIKKTRTLEEENSKFRKETRMLRSAYERLDDELRNYRAKPFLEEFKGIRRYEKELIKVLRERKQVGNEDLLEVLGVDPRQSESVKAISKQLENLEAYGLVEPTIGGWRWIG
jgi:predicted RNase H-like nuclease (RuvC/YqgF family)